jgi:hypothetical protein
MGDVRALRACRLRMEEEGPRENRDHCLQPQLSVELQIGFRPTDEDIGRPSAPLLLSSEPRSLEASRPV